MPAPIDLATRQQVYLERLKAGMVRNYGTAQESLRRRIRETLSAIEAGNMGELSRREVSKLVLQLREAHTGVTFAAMDAFLDELPDLAAYAANLELSQLRKLVAPVFPPPAINSGMLAFDRESFRDRSKAFWKEAFAKGDATTTARSMKPVIVTKDGPKLTLQDGRHRLTEAEAAGAREINVTFVEYDASGQNQVSRETRVVALGEVAAPALRFNMPTAQMAYQRALASPVQATGELLEPFIKNWAQGDAIRLGNVVRNGWAQGKTLPQMIRDVVGTRANGYKDGILDVSRRTAGTVINTATQHVANAARQKVWEDNGDLVKKYQWVATLDRRTTQQCKSLDGRQFEAGKGPMPPIHPNCRSTTIAVLGSEWDWLDEGGTRASSGPNPGYVPADETYYDWLGKQPADFQTVALGPSRAKLFRDGGLTPERFAELNLGRDFEPLTLPEMRAIEPDAFKRAGL